MPKLKIVIAAGILTAAAPLLTAARDAATSDYLHDIVRKGKTIGMHQIAFSEDDGALVVDIAIKMKVKIAFITVFRYEHSNREIWRDGRLQSIRTRTNDNGKKYDVEGVRLDDRFEVTVNGTTLSHNRDIVPSTYWNPALLDQAELLNTQTGKAMAVTISELGPDTVRTPTGETAAHRYRIEEIGPIDLWYDAAGCFLKLSFQASRRGEGSWIDYEPVALFDPAANAALADQPLLAQCYGDGRKHVAADGSRGG
ncbi:MAG: DUF6134 family protein [Sphingomonadales bacterium]|nr:DUF6134 family protein [Sphingomonadales bacterium]